MATALTETLAAVEPPLAPDPATMMPADAALGGPDAPADGVPAAIVAGAQAQDAAPGDTPVAPVAPVAPDLSPAATGARLATLFPALFVGPDGRGTWRAIKLRIHADIQARAPGEFSKRTLGIFFSRYTTTTAYLKALAAPGAQRCDLDGQPAGEIAEEHRNAAAEEVARRQAIVAERRAAQRKAQVPQRAPAPAPEGGEAPARAPRPARPQRDSAAPRQSVDRPEGPAREPQERPPRQERLPRREPAHARPHDRRDDRPEARASRGAARHDAPPSARDVIPAATLPADPAQRDRALLLRSFESSPLSKANFCALKRMSEADLDTQLAQARAERGSR